MQSKHINPFLQAALFIIEQMCQVRPQVGQLQLKKIEFEQGPFWLYIKVFGDMEGAVIYRFPEPVALALASGMMGGFPLSALDEISKSAISELGNMISGNASTILSGEGVTIDISPPTPVESQLNIPITDKALIIPLQLDSIGEFEICVNLKSE